MSGIDRRDLEELTPEELKAQEPGPLPQREVMSLLTPVASALPAFTGAEAPGIVDATPTGGAQDSANDAAGLGQTSADATGTEPGTATVTEADRSETITQSDSAVAGQL